MRLRPRTTDAPTGTLRRMTMGSARATRPIPEASVRVATITRMQSTVVTEYARHLERRGLAAVTIARRLRAIELLAELHPLATMPTETIEQFLDARRGRDGALDARTRTCWLSHLHCFYQWAVNWGHFDTDPTVRLVRPKLRRRLPRPIPEDAFLRAVDAAPTPMLRAWLLLAGNAGLRCCEIARLRGEDVWPGGLRVLGKNDKERVVPMHPRLADVAATWPTSGPVFIDPATGEPYRPAQVSKLIGDLFRRNHLPYRAHQARHRFASQVYEQTGDLNIVAELCGHESIETTRIYAAVSPGRSARAVALIA